MKQDGLALLLGVPEKKSKESSGGGALKDAATAILDAIKDDDAEALARALTLAVGECECSACESDDEDEE